MSDVALVLCPASMTAPHGGPAGVLGDRVHQLPAVARVAATHARTLVWPWDGVTRELFPGLPIEPIAATSAEQAAESARRARVRVIYALYADPTGAPHVLAESAAAVRAAHAVATAVARDHAVHLALPDGLRPDSRVPLWQRLYLLADPGAAEEPRWPAPPWLSPQPEAVTWAEQIMAPIRAGDPVLVLSPFSGGDKSALTPGWFRRLAREYTHGRIVVPYHGDGEAARAEALFFGLDHVIRVGATIQQVAALAADPRSRIIGIDGGRTLTLVAASPRGALVAFGAWPASAWGLPTMVVRDPDLDRLTPRDALTLMP